MFAVRESRTAKFEKRMPFFNRFGVGIPDEAVAGPARTHGPEGTGGKECRKR